MKRNIIILFVVALLLTACGTKATDDRGKNTEQAPDRVFNESMSEEQFTQVTYDFIEYSTELGEAFEKMSSLCEKYSDEINNAETFDWSQYWDFREVKEDINSLCEKIINYDDSICSKEYQLCLDEFKGMAYQIQTFFNTVSCEMDTKEIDALTQQLMNDVNTGFNYAIVYQVMATAAYMESTGAEQERIDQVLASVKDSNIYKDAKGIRTTGTSTQPSSYNIVFTNSFGTPNTKCNHSGCNNSIASSGDTNCCVIHSNKCLNCGKYIDEDAMFCMDCLSGRSPKLEDTGKYDSSNVPKSGCQYQYFDGSLCGKPTNHYASLCDEHFKQLNDTYNALIGQ